MAGKSKTGKVMKGVGITAAVAAAAVGAYYFYGTEEGKKNRKKIESWAHQAKKEVAGQLKKLKEVNEGAYNKTVDAVMAKYKKIKEVDPRELALMARELKGHWQKIQKEFQATRKTVKRMVKKPVKSKPRKRR